MSPRCPLPLSWYAYNGIPVLYLSRITSRDIGQTAQPERLGIFTSYGETKHGRKVYQKQTPGQRDQFLYFWDWGPNNGGNWFVGLDPGIFFYINIFFYTL